MKQFLLVLLVILLMCFTWVVGYHVGIHHAINDAMIWAEEDGIMLDLDGQVYLYEAF